MDNVTESDTPVDRLKSRHAAGVPSIGTFLHIPSPALVEICGLLGFDWMVLDGEHGPLEVETLEHMARAADVVGLVTFARLPYPDARLVNRLLDTGVSGVLVPHFSSAELARSVVNAAKYSPIGHRGAGANTRAARYGVTMTATEYAGRANDQTLVWGILEDPHVVDELPAILDVEGVDGFVIGHSDLSHGLGLPGQVSSQQVEDVIGEITNQVLAAKKMLCRVVRKGDASMIEEAAGYIDGGVSSVAVSATSLLKWAAHDFVELKSR
jgi:4-hydroxy-2-oxoheptanedioate aldolase